MRQSAFSEKADQPPVNRREFLYYLWTASAALLLVEGGVGLAWYLSARMSSNPKRFIELDLKKLPAVGASPVRLVANKPVVWLNNTSAGVYVFRDICTYHGCIFMDSDQGTQLHPYPHFICPCCGSQFNYDGHRVYGPALRNLHQVQVIVETADGRRVTPDSGGPVNIDGAKRTTVALDVLIYGKLRPEVKQLAY